MKSGVYETNYGNAASYVENGTKAFDLDMAEEIPMDFMTDKFIRELDDTDYTAEEWPDET